MKPPSKSGIDPFFIFLQGKAFFQANRLIHSATESSPDKNCELRIPACTMSVFACELFLKCLLCIETNSVPRGHNLRRLYDSLKGTTRRELEALWDKYASEGKPTWDAYETQFSIVIPRDLPSAFFGESRAFEGRSYIYEPNKPLFRYSLDDFP